MRGELVDPPVPTVVRVVAAKDLAGTVVGARLVDAVVDDHQIELLFVQESVLLQAVQGVLCR